MRKRILELKRFRSWINPDEKENMDTNIFTSRSRIVITCSKRLAPFLEKEVKELGFELERIFATGLELFGTVNDCIQLNLNLRCASQVHFSLKEFEAKHPDELYRVW